MLARFLGAGLAAATVITVVFTDWEQCGGSGSNGFRGRIALVLPAAVAVIFSLPKPDLGAYFRNGAGAALGIAIVAGIYGSGVESPSSCELLYGGSDGYFIFWGLVSLVLLAIGSVPFGVLLVIYRVINRHTRRKATA